MLDLLIRNANLPDGEKGIDIAIENGSIIQVGPKLDVQATREIDATDRLATPPFVEPAARECKRYPVRGH
jgi:cytosine deaminase